MKIDNKTLLLIGGGIVLYYLYNKKQKSQYDKDCGCGDKILYDDMEEGEFKRISKEKGFGCSLKEPKSQSDCKPGCKFVMGSSSDGMMMVYTPNSCVKDENY